MSGCSRPRASQRMAWRALVSPRPSCWARGRECPEAGSLPSMVSILQWAFATSKSADRLQLFLHPKVPPAACCHNQPRAC